MVYEHYNNGNLTQTLNMTYLQWKLLFQPLSSRAYVNLLEGITTVYGIQQLDGQQTKNKSRLGAPPFAWYHWSSVPFPAPSHISLNDPKHCRFFKGGSDVFCLTNPIKWGCERIGMYNMGYIYILSSTSLESLGPRHNQARSRVTWTIRWKMKFPCDFLWFAEPCAMNRTGSHHSHQSSMISLFLELYFPYLKYHKVSSPNQRHRDSPILPGRTLCSSPQIQNDTHPHTKIKYVHLTTV